MIRLWDLPTRLFHWLLVICAAGALVTVKFDVGGMTWHGRFGQAVLALVVFRVVWGVVGSTYARFTSFVRGPLTILAYLRGSAQGRWPGVGHNPLGALSVLALLALMGFQATTGLFATNDVAFTGPLYRAVSMDWNRTLSGWHRQAEWFIYGLILLHLAAIAFYTLIRKDNLVTPMITGRKPVSETGQQDARGGGWLALVIALVITAGVMWVANGGLLAPLPPPVPDPGW